MKTYNNSVVLRNDGIDPSTTNADLNAGTGVNITVRIASNPVAGEGALASIFNVADVAIANPMQTDNQGNYTFKVTDGFYDIVIAEGTADETIIAAEDISGIIDNLSMPYIFDTVAEFKASLIEFPDGKTIHLNDRDADFIKITGTGTANTFNIIASTSIDQSIVALESARGWNGKAFGISSSNPDNTDAFNSWMTVVNDRSNGSTLATITSSRDKKFPHSSTLIIPENVQLVGNSGFECAFIKTSDVIGIIFKGRILTGIGSLADTSLATNTNDGIQIETLAKFYINDIMGGDVSGAEGNMGHGRDGVSLRKGNNGFIGQVRAVSNGRRGFFSDSFSIDDNAITYGAMDVRGNVENGFHLDSGSSSSDITRSNANYGGLITSQNNGGIGIFIGSQQNIITVYSEANGTGSVVFGANSRSNVIHCVEGQLTSDSGSRNKFTGANDNGDFRAFSTVERTHELIIDKNVFGGRLSLTQTADLLFQELFDGSSSDMTIEAKHVNDRIISRTVASGTKSRYIGHTYIDPSVITISTAGTTVVSADSPNILADATLGDIVITINSGNVIPGLKYFVKKLDSSANLVKIRIDNVTNRIDGSEVVLNAQYDGAVVLITSSTIGTLYSKT